MSEVKLEQKAWHIKLCDQILAELHSVAASGLSSDEARRRYAQYGPNQLTEARSTSIATLFLNQFRDFMILILLLAALVAGVVGELKDSIAILVIVVLNAIIGAAQQFRAESAIAALRKMAAPEAHVLRDAYHSKIAASELVPGDIVVLEEGAIIAADLRLFETVQLQVDESALTGESTVVEKTSAALTTVDLPVGDRLNMAYRGTRITRGRGLGIVVATGMQTEVGAIADLLTSSETVKTPLQRRLTIFGKRLAVVVLLICAVIFAIGLLRGEAWILMLLTAVSLAVAAIPEALPAVVSISLALGAHKMSDKKALIRNLPAVETLGSVTYICADKTGTLTKNRMQLEAVVTLQERRSALTGGDNANRLDTLFGQCMALNNEVQVSAEGTCTGDPTEIALYEAAQSAGFNKQELEKRLPRKADLPFSSERQRMSTLHQNDAGVLLFCKGAPEATIPLCVDALPAAGTETTQLDEQYWYAEVERLTEQGYRVLALAYCQLTQLPKALAENEVESGLTLLGLAGMIDPPRDEAFDAVADCLSAGIKPVMITGDHPGTARAIAKRLGIVDEVDSVLSGTQLQDVSEEALHQQVGDVRVFARVSPAQKIRIVKALQQQGQFVAMTGDGVNDAPALQRADIGVAMGEKGTDVAREAAAMVLLDDNFATIVSAIREGRRIFDNIRKFVKYTMTSNIGEIWTLFLAPFFGLPLPLLPIHILWINLVTDGLPGLALTMQPEESGIMQRRPRPPSESLFAHGMWQHMLVIGLLIGAVSLGSQYWAIREGLHWQTVVFTVLTFSQLAHVLVIQDDRDSLFNTGILHNKTLLGAVFLTIALQLAIIYLPFMNPIFRTAPLTLAELMLCLTLPLGIVAAVEVEKWLIRGGRIYNSAPQMRSA
ncbi:MAG: cation-translocating P-type ATPase [Pseudomonadales bacterium]